MTYFSNRLELINNLLMNIEELNVLLVRQLESISKLNSLKNKINPSGDISNLLGFRNMSLTKISKKLCKNGINGLLTRKEYNSFFKKRIKKNKTKFSSNEKVKIEYFVNQLYIKLKKNKLINYKPLLCGLSLLSNDSIEKKTKFIENLFYSLHSPTLSVNDITSFLDGYFSVWNLIHPSKIGSTSVGNIIINIMSFYKNEDGTITRLKFKMLINSLFLIYQNFKK